MRIGRSIKNDGGENCLGFGEIVVGVAILTMVWCCIDLGEYFGWLGES